MRWGPPEETAETCHGREDVLRRLSQQRAAGLKTQVLEVTPGEDAILVGLCVRRPQSADQTVYQVLGLRNGMVADIRGFQSRAEAAARAGASGPRMIVQGITPILNVSNLQESFDWFAKLGWAKKWDWSGSDDGSEGRASFGAVGCDGFEIFLCQRCQGAGGVWLTVWVADADEVETICRREGLAVVRAAQDEPWGVREVHVRHPDGHVFRVTGPIRR